LGAIAAIAPRTCAITAAKFGMPCWVGTPKSGPRSASAAACAARISAFDGTQPRLRQSPPISAFSISVTLARTVAAM